MGSINWVARRARGRELSRRAHICQAWAWGRDKEAILSLPRGQSLAVA